MAEIEVGDSVSQAACEDTSQVRRVRIPLDALERPALLAHDFIPRLEDRPLVTVRANGTIAYRGRPLFPAPENLVQVVSDQQRAIEHWTVFTGDPDAPFLFLFSGGFNDMFGVAAGAALLGGRKPRPFRPGLGDGGMPAHLVGLSAEGVIVNEQFYCNMQTHTIWAVRNGAVTRLRGGFRFPEELELAVGERPRQLRVYQASAGGKPQTLVVKAPGKLELLRVDFESGRVLFSWKGEERWADWKVMRKAFDERLYQLGSCGAG
jgi:hypothetical protein